MGGDGSAFQKFLRAPYVFTVFLGLSLVVYCCFAAFSIGVLDVSEESLQNQRPPWPTLQSPVSARRWRGLKSSKSVNHVVNHPVKPTERALQGMGTLFRKGTRSMRELIVAHLAENTTTANLRLFLRTLHRSGATARADVLLLFPGTASIAPELVSVIMEEEASFQRLLALSDYTSNSTLSPFNATVFKEEVREEHVMWGNRSSKPMASWARYGSTVGFAMQELDAHNEMSGFFDDPPAQLRRWVCYDMILGMVRTKYKNVILTPVKGVLVVGDAFSAVRRRHHLYLSAEDRSWLDADGLIPSVYGDEVWRKLDKAHREKVVVSSSFAMGRIDYVRKLANKMATEIVRIALEKKSRRCFHDKAVLNYLVHQSSVLGKRVLEHVKIAANKDSVVHSLAGSKQPHAFWKRKARDGYAIIQGLDSERGHKLVASLHDDICRSPAASQVYQDCL